MNLEKQIQQINNKLTNVSDNQIKEITNETILYKNLPCYFVDEKKNEEIITNCYCFINQNEFSDILYNKYNENNSLQLKINIKINQIKYDGSRYIENFTFKSSNFISRKFLSLNRDIHYHYIYFCFNKIPAAICYNDLIYLCKNTQTNKNLFIECFGTFYLLDNKDERRESIISNPMHEGLVKITLKVKDN